MKPRNSSHKRCSAQVELTSERVVSSVRPGLPVLDVFNASIAADQIREEFIHNPADPLSPGGCWESAVDGGEHRIGLGAEAG